MVETTSRRPISSGEPSRTNNPSSSTLVPPAPAESSSGSLQKKKPLPNFKKKSTLLAATSTTSSAAEPKESLPVEALDNSWPLRWHLGGCLNPLTPATVASLQSYGELCQQYFSHFKQQQMGVFI